MDLREFIDQGCWVIDAVTSYLKLTGDFAFLDEKCGYYRIVDEAARSVEKSEITDTVLDHMLRIMDYLLSNKDTKTDCIKVLYGDWNDALDGLGVSADPGEKFGNGVSVMASLQVVKNLQDIIELLEKLGIKNDICKRYQEEKRSLTNGLMKNAVVTNEKGERRILHGWGHDRAYFVGSFHDPDNKDRYGLTSNAFWILSGLIKEDDSMKEEILSAYNALDSKYGLKTFHPAFGRDVKGVGRIYKLPVGTAENGASYIHATTFAIMSLFRIGESRRAWEQMEKILPFTHEKVSCSAFVMPNSYGFNPELHIDGESMQDWQTGSSNVLFKTFVRFIFGFNPDYDALTVSPANYCPFQEFSASFVYQGRTINLRYRKESGKVGDAAESVRHFYLNGEEMAAEYDASRRTYQLVLGKDKLADLNTITVVDS